MKLSISMEHGLQMTGGDYNKTASIMVQAGFHGIDLDATLGDFVPGMLATPEQLQHITRCARAAQGAGLAVTQCHMPYLPGHIDHPGDGSFAAYRDALLPSFRQLIPIVARLGCPDAVIHPYFSSDSTTATVQGNIQLIQELLPLLQQNGIRLCIENIYCVRDGRYQSTPVSNAETILQIIRGVDSPLVGACLDTGHAHLCGKDFCSMALQYGEKLYALHVNGNQSGDEHVIPATMSDWCENMAWDRFTDVLRQIGYGGSYNLEVACGKLPAKVVEPFYRYAAAVADALVN